MSKRFSNAAPKCILSAICTGALAHYALGVDLWAAPATAQIVAMAVVVTVIVCGVMS